MEPSASSTRGSSPKESGNGASHEGRIVRISTGLGTIVVVIVNDLGSLADPLIREIEADVLARMRAHRQIVPETNTVEVQHGDLQTRVIEW